MKMKKQLLPVLMIILALGFSTLAQSEVIEQIYAVVNGEMITHSELKSIESDMIQILSQQYQGEELATEITKIKKNLLKQLIDRKIILSYARDKNYDLDAEVDLVIKDIKKQYNIKSDEELQNALNSQGLDYDAWRKRLKEDRMQGKYIYEMIGSKINIDNSLIMSYYKDHIDEFTLPLKLELNCIFLSKTNYLSPKLLEEKKETINNELKSSPFEEVAKKYSELPNNEKNINYYLGEFKKGELDPTLESSTINLQPGAYSNWIETDNGWYITQLIKKTEPELVEYKKVRSDIEYKLRQIEQEKRVDKFVDDLKKESYIKIYGTPGPGYEYNESVSTNDETPAETKTENKTAGQDDEKK